MIKSFNVTVASILLKRDHPSLNTSAYRISMTLPFIASWISDIAYGRNKNTPSIFPQPESEKEWARKVWYFLEEVAESGVRFKEVSRLTSCISCQEDETKKGIVIGYALKVNLIGKTGKRLLSFVLTFSPYELLSCLKC